ncbi:helix-turn-helix transcriptional regulator [Methanobrevibacter olleyae]|uniref:Transcriptional regulator n=1 Tax=Methanobrevibacter olleyae TaxID=294671 RepID=A0A126R0D3_METOL|nr:transcriptional regulator FilR1 domain-containing protein [Methanobrevibacter olleyae]AMK15506.1 transcriptional regulator [Methanobrevibacter olleyae]SFL37722.1 Predicted transcriptional regulator, contains HTH domain [Methanobrevibacter olleyae]
MSTKFNEEYFQDFQEDIKFLINSDIRLEILGYLYNSSASIKEIEERTNFSYSSILDNINKLEQRKFIFSIDDKFYLYNKTKLKLTNILYFNKTTNFLRDNSDFLNQSLIDINIDTIKDLSALEGSKLIESNNIDLFKPTEIFQDSLMGFKFLKGIFPYFHPNHYDIISYWIDNDCTVELILPDAVSEAVKNFIKDYLPKSPAIKNKHVKLKPNDSNIQFAFTVSDKCLVLAFYTKNGQFNQNAVITSTNQEAINFGLKLFEEYEKLCGDYVSLDYIIYPDGRGKNY